MGGLERLVGVCNPVGLRVFELRSIVLLGEPSFGGGLRIEDNGPELGLESVVGPGSLTATGG